MDEQASSDLVQISQGEYKALLAAKAFLECLRDCGVEKWEGYSFAISIYASKEVKHNE